MGWFKRKKSVAELKLELKRKKISELVDAMLASEIEVHYAPISQEYFIIDKSNQVNICLSDNSIRVANHAYLYEVNFSMGTMAELIKKAKQKVEEKTTAIKKELFKNEVELIDKVKKLYVTD